MSIIPIINKEPNTGRYQKEDNSVINFADIIAAVYDAVNGKIKINANAQIGNIDISNTNQMPTEVPAFKAYGQITRSSTVTAYTPGQLILPSAASVLPEIDVSTQLGFSVANRKIGVTSAFLISDNGANNAFAGFVDIFGVNNPAVAVSLADYATFAPTAAGLVANFNNSLDDVGVTNSRKYGSAANLSWQTDIIRKFTLDAAGKLYFAPVCLAAYTPKNAEVLTLILKFYLLN